MTDSVNVPSDPTDAMIEAMDDAIFKCGNVTDAYRAMLAAAPKAEPVRWTEDIERESRERDYERGFRDGQLSQPEAPKEEQEPLGKWLSAALDDPAVCQEMKRDIRDWFARGCPPLPAPASDDLPNLWWSVEDWEETFDNVEDAYDVATGGEMRGVACLGHAIEQTRKYAVRIDIDTTGDGDADDYEIRMFDSLEAAEQQLAKHKGPQSKMFKALKANS